MPPSRAPQPNQNISPTLAVKLGSAIVHADEAMSADGHAADESAFRSILADPEVSAWLAAMNELALLPVKRNPDA